MQPCVLCNSLWKNAILALIGILFVLGMLATGTVAKMPWGIALFGLMTLFFGYRTLDRRPRVIIDGRGITELRNKIGLIQWNDISEARFASGGRVDFIYVTVHDPEHWRTKLPVVYRLFWATFQERRVINIPLQNMATTDKEVQNCLMKWMHTGGNGRTMDSSVSGNA